MKTGEYTYNDVWFDWFFYGHAHKSGTLGT